MQFTSFGFLLFAALLLLLYYTVPKKGQWLLLLAASCAFYLQAGTRYPVFLLVTILTTYATARLMAHNLEVCHKKTARKKNRVCLAACLAANFGILVVCKLHVTVYDLALPLGISFYMFQSMGYVVDVYRGTVRAERNLLKLALFVSFFPQLLQGPISKYSQLAPQLCKPHDFDGKQVSFGLQRMLWGYFKKLVIADRIAVAVVELKAPQYTGVSFAVLSVFYAVQIYGDFTGGIDIALGLAEAMGIKLPENFIRPFFSQNIAQYWRRWHISLGAWMKDYIFYPISVSRPILKLSKSARKKLGSFGKRLPVYAASVATWFITGIWHGLTPNFILWGMMNCFVTVVSEELSPLYAKFHARFRLKEKKWYGAFEMLRMFCLMNLIRIVDLFPDVGEYFRRMGSLIPARNFHILWDGTLMKLGLSALDYGILILGIGLMVAISLAQEKSGSVRELLWQKNTFLRYALTFGLFLSVLLMGSYGIGYDAGSFIYNQF